MNNKKLIIILVLLVLSTSLAFGNSAEPPSLIIIVPSMTDAVEISIVNDNETIEKSKVNKIFETYHQFYLYDLTQKEQISLKVETELDTFTIEINKPFNRYRNIYTLDLDTRSIIKGYNRPFLNVLLIMMRIVLTLLIEGFIFYALGFHLKDSWRKFLMINLFTQGALNIWLSTFNLDNGYGVFFALVFSEIIIIILEIIAFLIGIKEKNKVIIFIHVILANVLSFVLGGYLITRLPL